MHSSTILAAALAVIAVAADSRGGHAVFRSTDGGRTWSRSDRGLPGDSRINAFESFGESIFAGTDTGIFVSGDRGVGWRRSGASTAADRISSFAVLGTSIFAGVAGSGGPTAQPSPGRGLLASSDGGFTWRPVAGFPSGNVRCLLAHEGRLYAGTDADGVLVSSDGGRNWRRINEGLPAGAQIFALTAVRGRLFGGLYAKGLYGWIEGRNGQDGRWMKTGAVSPLVLAAVGDTLIAGHNPGGIHWSNGAGGSGGSASAWFRGEASREAAHRAGELTPGAAVWAMASGGERVLAGASSGIYISGDRGRTWTRARLGLPAESPGVSFLVAGDVILAGALTPARPR